MNNTTYPAFLLPIFILSLLLLSVTSLTVNADDSYKDDSYTKGNKVHFSITESQNVANNRITLTFNRVAEGISPQAVANEINLKMQAAIRALKAYPEIITQTNQYNIRPIYKKQVISHWRGQQSLVLSIENKPGLIAILTKIQPYLAYQSMQFGISDSVKKQVMAQLTDKAIQSYRKQAQRIANNFQASSFRILETRINNANGYTPQPRYARSEMAMMSSDMAAPAVKVGQSKLNVTITGTLLLTP
ncbi:SIMPL domain-containing protein [Thiomicrorhabdus sp. Milos-T2]|uniref:SIMPL domain-containing protein n=1 Tax=Thiomicrorhabdus sp. Milos-T2 TaxID=90814 RepID=UPI000493F69B|nr:SIMPL domain-containing protein [Thiomicrorhabdus sp. Milos-T2]